MRIDQIEWQAVTSCQPDTRISAVRKLFDQSKADSVLLMEGGLVIGCVQRDDLVGQGLQTGPSWERLPIGPYAHSCTFHAAPEMDVDEVIHWMLRHRISVVAVKQNHKVVGMVSKVQLITALAKATMPA